jgi:hypothetical protein
VARRAVVFVLGKGGAFALAAAGDDQFLHRLGRDHHRFLRELQAHAAAADPAHGAVGAVEAFEADLHLFADAGLDRRCDHRAVAGHVHDRHVVAALAEAYFGAVGEVQVAVLGTLVGGARLGARDGERGEARPFLGRRGGGAPRRPLRQKSGAACPFRHH